MAEGYEWKGMEGYELLLIIDSCCSFYLLIISCTMIFNILIRHWLITDRERKMSSIESSVTASSGYWELLCDLTSNYLLSWLLEARKKIMKVQLKEARLQEIYLLMMLLLFFVFFFFHIVKNIFFSMTIVFHLILKNSPKVENTKKNV